MHALLLTLLAFLSLPVTGAPAPERPAAAIAPAAASVPGSPRVSGAAAYAAALAVDGDRLYVGEPGEISLFPMPANRAGRVHVYVRAAGGDWRRESTLRAAGVEIGDAFGEAMAARGEVLAVGAPGVGEGRGAVYLFVRSDGGWTEAARLDAPADAGAAGFGAAVAVTADGLLVGAPEHGDGAGAVFAFRRGAGGWEPAGVVTGPTPGGRLGAALSADGERVAAGAPGSFPAMMPGVQAPPPQPGAVHLLERSAAGWAIAATLEPAAEGPGMLGQALVLRGDELWAAAPLAGGTGQVLRFESGGDGWTATDTLRNSAQGFTGFGLGLAVADGDVLVGAPMLAQSGGDNVLYVFRRDDAGGWTREELAGPAGGMHLFGLTIVASGATAVVGAPGGDTFEGVGHVYIRAADGEWRPGPELVEATESLAAVTGAPRPCADGEVEGRECQGVDLLAFLPVADLGGERGVIVNDLWGWTDPETGREYGLIGRSDGTVFVDVTDPSSPRVLGELPRTEGSPESLWRDVKVYADHAFIVADGAGEHGMQVFDLRRLRDAAGEPATFEPDAVYDGIASAHNIVLDAESGLAATVGSSGGGHTCGGGLHMVDVRDPSNPTFVGCFTDPATGMGSGYTHDAQCVMYRGPDERYRGRQICLGSNGDALSIADVTDPEQPESLAAATYPNSAFLHQGWFSEDQRYFYMNDEIDELSGLVPRTRTLVWDLSELDDPVLVNEHLGTTSATDHNLYVRGDTMYQANYVSGLRVLDISDPESPREVGYFDTVPAGENTPGFAGAWSVYPFFESGTLLVTSMKEGLFILKTAPTTVF